MAVDYIAENRRNRLRRSQEAAWMQDEVEPLQDVPSAELPLELFGATMALDPLRNEADQTDLLQHLVVDYLGRYIVDDSVGKPSLPANLSLYARLETDMRAARERYEAMADGDEDVPTFNDRAWNRAVDFVTHNAALLKESWNRTIDAPLLVPTSDGGIDIEWTCKGRDLGIHIPEDPDTPGSYYGKEATGDVIQGTFRPSGNTVYLLVWLVL